MIYDYRGREWSLVVVVEFLEEGVGVVGGIVLHDLLGVQVVDLVDVLSQFRSRGSLDLLDLLQPFR